MNTSVFKKYNQQGAYHWRMISKNLRYHSPFVTARYYLTLNLLGEVKNKKILDFGCGDGALSGLIAQKGGMIYGVDSSQEGLKLAEQEFSNRNLKGEFQPSSINFSDHFFDKIICAEVLEHVDDPASILIEIHRLLKPDGIAVFSTPIRVTEYPLDKEHINEYYPGEFKVLVNEHFKILEYVQALPVGLQEISFIRGISGRLLKYCLNLLSAWFKWNYFLRIKGNFQLHSIQFIKVSSL